MNLPKKKTEEQVLCDSIWAAKREWDLAEARFQEATGREMVDFAIYDAMAARKKYMYLLMKARQMGL